MTYEGTGDLTVARKAVETALEKAGLRCRCSQLSDQCFLIEGEQTASWYRVLLGARAQKGRWHLEKSGDLLRLSSDFHLFHWYAAVIVLLWGGIAACFIFSLLIAEKEWLTGTRGALVGDGLVLLAVALMPVVVNLLGALGGRPAETLWHQVLREVEKHRDRLAPQGRGGTLRHSIPLIVFFGFSLTLCLGFVLYSLRRSKFSLPGGGTVFLMLLFAAIALLVVTTAMMLVRRGFNLRTYPIVSGLAAMVSVLLLFQGFLLPWWMASRMDLEALGPRLRAFGWLALGLGFFFTAVVAFVFLRYAVYLSILFQAQLRRLAAPEREGLYRLAVGGASPVPFQILFILSWLLLACMILATLGLVVACAVQGLVPFSSRPELRLVELSARAISAAVGRPAGDGLILLGVRSFWLLLAAAGMGLLALSAGQLFRSRRVERAAFAAAARRVFPRRDELETVLEELRNKAGLAPIRLVLWMERDLSSVSERFGLFRGESYVALSSRLLEEPAEHLKAILAHECAHHRLGHVVLRSLLLWLGRISFAGDGFVFALQSSFGYEKSADRLAADLLGDESRDLVAFLEKGNSSPDPPGPSPVAVLGQPLAKRWRVAWYTFRAQYCGWKINRDYYWHPGSVERIEALRDRG